MEGVSLLGLKGNAEFFSSHMGSHISHASPKYLLILFNFSKFEKHTFVKKRSKSLSNYERLHKQVLMLLASLKADLHWRTIKHNRAVFCFILVRSCEASFCCACLSYSALAREMCLHWDTLMHSCAQCTIVSLFASRLPSCMFQ